jgi:hypothetical protein
VVTFVGNVVAAKGPHVACQAADLAARLTGRPFRVRVVGDAWHGRGGVTSYESWLREQCATLGTPVEFVPHVDRHRVAALLEAKASPVLVVCSDIAGMREVGGDAVLARLEDVEALADVLASLAEDPAAYAERSRMVWERAREFS